MKYTKFLMVMSEFVIKIKDFIINKIIKRIDHKILVYFVFVAISTVFWFLNKLNDDYSSTIDYPVRYAHLPKNKFLINKPPEFLTLNVTAYGYTLLRYKLNPAIFPVVINVDEYSKNIYKKGNSQLLVLQTRYIREVINKQLSDDVNIIDILPDIITLKFADIITKKVVIKPNVELKFNKECMLDGNITFSPDSIEITGPSVILDTLTAVYTKIHKFKKLYKSIKRNVALQSIENVKFSKHKVIINLPVSKFTQENFEVGIRSINVPDTLEFITFPRIVKVSCMLSLNNYKKMRSKDFILEVDYNDIKNLLGQKLPVKLTFAPYNVKNVTYYPESVEFILNKKP
jgi:hypothetical protein